jgi:hypothetical protein
MFRVIRRIVAALLNRSRLFNPPADPHASVRVPRARRPGGGRSAVAVEEPVL